MKYYVDRLSFKTKPDSNLIGNIRNNIKKNYGVKNQTGITPLISSIENGRTVQLGIYDTESKFVEQSLFMLDFDNPTENPAELLYIENNNFIKENALFIYKSFSFKENIPKFRVVFALENPVFSESDVSKVYDYLINEFPQSDTVIGQPNRLFFGSKQPIMEINLENKLTVPKYIFEELPEIIPKTLSTEQEILGKQFSLINSYYTKISIQEYLDLPIYKLFELNKYQVIKEKFLLKYGKDFSYILPDPINASKIFKHELDMIDFLELPVDKEGKAFSDILSDDSQPSASVYRHDKSNVQLYKRFNSSGDKKTYDLILLISELCGLTYIQVTEKLIEITGSTIDTNSDVYKHKMGVKMFQMFISESETDELYPYFMNIIRPNTAVIITLLDIMSHSYKQVGNDVMLINNMSVRYLTSQVNRIHNSNFNPQKIAKILDQLAMFTVTKKLKDSEVPTPILAPLIAQKKDKNFKNRANITKVNVDKDNVTDILLDSNRKSKSLLENNYSMRMMSFEYILSVLGEQEALNVYPQKFTHREELLSEENKQEFEDKFRATAVNILNITYKDINEKGFALEKDIKQEYVSMGFSDKDFILFKSKLVNEYGLSRYKFSNKRKEELNAQNIEGYPFYYKKE